jgi:MFS family permease
MTHELTNAEKIQRLHWNTYMNAANSVFAQLSFFGSAFVLFLSELKLSNTQIGFLLSLLPFSGLVALFIAPTVARFGYKRTWITFFGLRKVVTAFLLLVPAVLASFGFDAMLAMVTIITGGFSLCRAIAETAIYPWAQEFIPNSIRGRYSATNDMISRITGMAAIALSGFVLGWSAMGLGRYMVLFAIAVVFGAVSVWCSTFIPGGAPLKEAHQVSHRDVLRVLRDRNFLIYILGIWIITIGTVPMMSFLPLFMEQQVGLSESETVLLSIGALLGGLSATYLMGWAADRYGSKPVLLSGLYIKLLLPVAWLLMPRHSGASLTAALIISFISGIADIAWILGSARLLYVRVVPAGKKAEYMAMYYAAVGLVGGISQVAGGRVLDFSGGLSGQFLFFTIDPFFPLFVIGLGFTAFSIVLFSRVQADSPVSVVEFAGLFTHGNPVLALESLVRYYRAKDERATVVMTERMGQTKSPLTVEELLEALQDPRFNVRFEAIISIARRDPDPRLVDALCAIVDGTELSLSVIAAWALGRLGDARAVPTLRNGLNSEYRSIRAHCARTLGTLRDSEMIPLLMQRLEVEPDKGLQIAYSSALGNLHAKEGVGLVGRILWQTENDGARIELTLALARIVGEEHHFIRLLRHFRQDKGTAASHALLFIRKHVNGEVDTDVERQLHECADAFAREEFQRATPMLSQLISCIPQDKFEPAVQTVLKDSAERMTPERKEYIILALHTLEMNVRSAAS